MQSGGSGAGDLINGTNGNGGRAGWLAALVLRVRSLGLAAAPGLMAEGLAYTPGDTFEKQVENQARYRADLQRAAGYFSSKNFWLGKAADPNFNAKEQFGIKTGLPNVGASPKAMDEILRQSADVGRQMAESLSVTATPNIDTSSIDAAQAKIDRVKASLGSLGSMISEAQAKIDAQMRRSFSDYGISP